MNKSIIRKLVFGGIMAVAGVATAVTVYNNKKTKDGKNKLKIKNLEDKNNKLTNENNILKDELEDLEDKYDILTDEKNNLKYELEDLKNMKTNDDKNKLKIKNLKNKNDKLTEENNNLKDELEDLKFTNDKLKSEIKLKDTLLSHSPRVETDEEKIHRQRRQIIEQQDEIDNLKAHIDQLNQIIDQQHDEILDLETKEEREQIERVKRSEKRKEQEKKHNNILWNIRGAVDELDEIWDQKEIIEKSKALINKLEEMARIQFEYATREGIGVAETEYIHLVEDLKFYDSAMILRIKLADPDLANKLAEKLDKINEIGLIDKRIRDRKLIE